MHVAMGFSSSQNAILPRTSCLSILRAVQTTLWQPAQRGPFRCSPTSKPPSMANFLCPSRKHQSPCGCCQRNGSNAALAPGDGLAQSQIKTQHTSQSRKSTLHLTVNSVNVITAVIPLSNQPPIPLSQLNTSASAKCSKEILLKTPDPGRSGEASGTKASESDSTDSNKFRLAASVGALDCDSVSPDRQSGGKWDGN